MTSSGDDLRGSARVATTAAFLVIAAFVAGKAARDATFLGHFAIEWLPAVAGVTAAVSLPIVIIAGRLMTRFGPHRMMPWVNVTSAVLLGVEWLMLPHVPGVIAVAVYLHLGALGAVLVSGFWSVINEQFDVQTAKRHLGRIGVGATLGGIAGGVIAERTAVHLEPGAILLVLAGLQLACALFLRVGGHPARAPGSEPEQRSPPRSAFRIVRESPLMRNLAIVVVLGAVGAAALDYVFKAEVSEASRGDPLRLFALYQIGASVVTAIFQLAFAKLALSRIGAARSISVLPITVAGFGLSAILFPTLGATLVSRGAESVVRSSVYRAGYELLFAPLPERDKRPAKVLLDVGAERFGDLLGTQIVGLIVFAVAAPRAPVLIVAGIAGLVAFAFAALLPGAYTQALERSLVRRGPTPEGMKPLLWSSIGSPTMSEAGADRIMLSLLDLPTGSPPPAPARDKRTRSKPPTAVARPADAVLAAIASLRSRDKERIHKVLSGSLTRELVPHVIPLLAWDEVAPEAVNMLSRSAPQWTGTLVDTLLDPATEFTIRRRLPAAIVAGDPMLAALGLWKGLDDQRFEVRYRCGRALGQLRAAGHEMPFADTDVYKRVLRELNVESERLRSYRLLDPATYDPSGVRPAPASPAAAVVAHVFDLLAIPLAVDAVRVSHESLLGADAHLRGTALEYLESALPDEVCRKLFPFLDQLTSNAS